MNGTRSTLEAYVLPAFINGLRLSAFPVAAGLRIRIGTRIKQMTLTYGLKTARDL